MTIAAAVILKRKRINQNGNKKKDKADKERKKHEGELVSPPNFVMCARHARTPVHAIREYTIAMWIQFLRHKRIAAKGSTRGVGRGRESFREKPIRSNWMASSRLHHRSEPRN